MNHAAERRAERDIVPVVLPQFAIIFKSASVKESGMRGSIKQRIGEAVSGRSVLMLAGLTLALAVPTSVIVRSLETGLVLPAFSIVLFCGAALTVLTAFFARTARNLKDLTLWDIAGGLAMTGCAASILSEPDQVTQLFEHLFERRSNLQQQE